jgi:IclR family transcriptional regulator, blcABC operon repressor
MLQPELAARPSGPSTAPARAGVALVPAVARAMALLDLLEKERESMTMARLAARLGLPKSSVHGLCNTLLALGYLRRQDGGSYFLGPRVMSLAHAFASRTSPAGEFNALWAESRTPPQETVILSVLDGPEVVYVAARHGDRPLGLAFSVGMRLPAWRAASGKAMLAFQDEARVRHLLPTARLPAFMTRPGRKRSELMAELAQVRELGYSVDDESVREGVFSFGAPVFDAAGHAVAGVGVCLQKATVSDSVWAENRDTVRAVAHELTLRLGGVPPEFSQENT